MIYIYILLAASLVCIVTIYAYTKGDVLSPAFIAFVGFFIALLCIIYNEDYWAATYDKFTFELVFWGFIFILMSDWCMFLLSKTKKNLRQVTYPECFLIKKELLNLLCGFMTVGFAWLFGEVFFTGRSLGASGLNAIGVFKESDASFSVVGKLFFEINNLFLVLVCFVLAYNTGSNKYVRKYSRRYIYPLLVGIFTLMISGSRSILFRTILIYVLICLISSRQHNERQKIEIKMIIKKAIAPLSIMVLMFYALRAVVKASGKSASRGFVEYITYYVGSPLYLFSKYVAAPNVIAEDSEYFGAYTFAGFYNTLYRIGLVPNSVPNLNFIYLGGNNYLGGNEFSLFMRPMHDFGIIGMYIFVIVLFSVFSYVYYFKISRCNGSSKSYRILMLYSYFFYIIVFSFYYPFTVQESKIMNIVYVMVLNLLFRILIRKGKKDESRNSNISYRI